MNGMAISFEPNEDGLLNDPASASTSSDLPADFALTLLGTPPTANIPSVM